MSNSPAPKNNVTTLRVRDTNGTLRFSISLDADAINHGVGAPHYYRRNALLVHELPSTRAENGMPNEAEASPHAIGHGHPIEPGTELTFLKNQDAHWQCGFFPMWKDTRKPRPRISGWKMPTNGDCRDVLQLNVLQALLTTARAIRPHLNIHTIGAQESQNLEKPY